MYSKEELTAKSVVQLKDIAKELGVKVKKSDNKGTIVYAILDAQAEQPAPEAAPKRKRTRIATKKEDRVYSVHGNEGENFDVKKNQALGPDGGDTAPQAKNETAQPAEAVEEESSSVRQSRVYNQLPRSKLLTKQAKTSRLRCLPTSRNTAAEEARLNSKP